MYEFINTKVNRLKKTASHSHICAGFLGERDIQVRDSHRARRKHPQHGGQPLSSEYVQRSTDQKDIFAWSLVDVQF